MLFGLILAHASMSGTAFKGGFNVGVQGGFGHTKLDLKLDDAFNKDIEKNKDFIDAVDKALDSVSETDLRNGLKNLNNDQGLPGVFKLTDDEIDQLGDQVGSYAKFAKELIQEVRTGKIATKSNNGFVGVHLGYLKRFEKFGFGGLFEGNFGFGSNLKFKVDGLNKLISESGYELAIRLNLALYMRAVIFATERMFVGADVGLAAQGIRMKGEDDENGNAKKDGTQQNTNKKTQWLPIWGPSIRAVLGIALTDRVVATATAGMMLPIKQGKYEDGSPLKPRMTSYQAGLGLSIYL